MGDFSFWCVFGTAFGNCFSEVIFFGVMQRVENEYCFLLLLFLNEENMKNNVTNVFKNKKTLSTIHFISAS